MIYKPGTKVHGRHILFSHLTRCGRSAAGSIKITVNENAITCQLCRKGLNWQYIKRVIHG